MDKEITNMGRVIAAIVLVAVLAVGGGLIATAAYQAGLSTAISTAAGSGGAVAAPVVVPAYGFAYGPHPFGFGFGFFGFLGTLLFLFIVFGLIRAILFRGGPGRRGGWGQGGWGHGALGEHGPLDDWHRRAHDDGPKSSPSSPSGPA